MRSAIDQQTRHTPLPVFKKLRPTPAGERQQPRTTVRDIFGVDGWFFDPDAATTSRPWAFAVLHLTGTCTPSGQGWAVREVDGYRRQFGPLALTRRDAVLGARRYGPLALNRPPTAQGVAASLHTDNPGVLIRTEERGQHLVLHVRCACPLSETTARAEFTGFASAAAWLDDKPQAPWRFCQSTPRRVTWTCRGDRGNPWSGTIQGTCRHHTGWAAMQVIGELGGYPQVFLRDLAADAIG
ncbi:hypothetical protein [Streptomyces anulatus]|uniref:hypothetical protein n=1 Tax=Streptomyces anulatus TaxID=1892 RepID=UPI001C261077|nr:hypothetical protein [Streptomyces anulatus]